jgi:hypothetical protein
MRSHLPGLLASLLFTLAGFVLFPGRSYLQSDTQIYAPVLEHLGDANLFQPDLLLDGAHLSFTIYDEAALLLRRVASLSLEQALVSQQFLFRWAGAFGLYLLALSITRRPSVAIFICGLASLGATIIGPAVLTIEYEPVPRGFAIGLLLLSLGLLAQGAMRSAAIGASIALLYHAPTVWPFWVVALLWSWRQRSVLFLTPLTGAITLLGLSAAFQAGIRESQPFLATLAPWHAELQQMRAAYNWISTWKPAVVWQYWLFGALLAGAAWRVREKIDGPLRWWLFGMPVIALLTMPLSWVFLEKLRWALLPQVQPMRSLLFVTLFCILLCGVAGTHATRWWERCLWLLAPFAIPAQMIVLDLPGNPERLLLVGALALLAALTLHFRSAFAPAVPLLAMWLYPGIGTVANVRPLLTPELDAAAAWAQQHTDRNAVFFFPLAGKDLAPGVFRERALRAVFVDWKGGGQVNYFPRYSLEWQRRWELYLKKPVGETAPLVNEGVDYLVTPPGNSLCPTTPLWSNAKYQICRISQPPVR